MTGREWNGRDETGVEARKFIEENFLSTSTFLPNKLCDVEFVPRWRCTDIVSGRWTTKGFWGEDRLWDAPWDVSYWRYID